MQNSGLVSDRNTLSSKEKNGFFQTQYDESSRAPSCYALIPAGGVGSRFGSVIPKQYLEVAGKTVLEWALAPFIRASWICKILVVVLERDAIAPVLFQDQSKVMVLPSAGKTRRDTVLAGLEAIQILCCAGFELSGVSEFLTHNQSIDLRTWNDAEGADTVGQGSDTIDPWVVVHDAVRPGLDTDTLDKLRYAVQGHPVGGLLGVPVHDTLKRCPQGAENSVVETLSRDGLWHAQTPQMFRLSLILKALSCFPDATDESVALERSGYAPVLVEGNSLNFKVTTQADWVLMQALLTQKFL